MASSPDDNHNHETTRLDDDAAVLPTSPAVTCDHSTTKQQHQHHHDDDHPPPLMTLSISRSTTFDIEDETDGVWSIVSGKASCRKIFSLDVTLFDSSGSPLNNHSLVFASLLYADNESPVENTNDENDEPPLLVFHDGIEYPSHDRPSKLVNGRASFKLKISKLSSKCDNRLFRIRFQIPESGGCPSVQTLSLPIRCISRGKSTTTKTSSASTITWRRTPANRMTYYMNGLGSRSLADGRSMELVPNIVREPTKPSPASKRIKLGHDDKQYAMFREAVKQANIRHDNKQYAMFKEQVKQPNKGHEENTNGTSIGRRRSEKHYGVENNNNSCGSNNSIEGTNSDPIKSMPGISSPISDLIIFKYCLGGPAERCHLLKELTLSTSEQQLANFAKQVSMFSGCLHHPHQINIGKRLVEEGIQAWTSISKEGSNHLLWKNLVPVIEEHFRRIACCTRSLTHQDFECLRRIAGCKDLVSQENFEDLWSWFYPVAFTLSRSAVNPMWDSVSPVWIEGFITKEEAESAVGFSPGGRGLLLDPGTFVLRFPTSRSWPHPDAGNLVVTYVGSDYKVHHRLLSFDFINSATTSSEEMIVKPLQDMLLDEPELSRLGRMRRSQ